MSWQMQRYPPCLRKPPTDNLGKPEENLREHCCMLVLLLSCSQYHLLLITIRVRIQANIFVFLPFMWVCEP